MGSTFMGLETSKRGLYTQQSALYTTGHNISNANTLGYSRQRVNMEATLGYPGTGLNAPKIPGHLGTGVQAQSVQRIRDSFVDTQYRQESNKLGYWDSRSQAITQMEDVLNEPSDYGLAKSMNEFWKSLQDLSVNPENGGARSVVVQRGVAVADSFNYLSKSISQIQENAGKEIGISLKDVNSILEQIASINEQIQAIEPNGYMPNDLYDARDTLLDELSTYLPIETSNVKSGGNALAIAEGSVTVKLKLNNGTSIDIISGKDFKQFRTSPALTTDNGGDGITPTGPVTGLSLVNVDASGKDSMPTDTISLSNLNDSGKIKSLVNSYGYETGDTTNPIKGLYPDMLAKLDKMAKAFAEEFNKLHAQGTDINGEKGGEFFVQKNPINGQSITASNISVSKDIIDDPNNLAASSSSIGEAEPGNGKQALALANMKFASLGDLGNVSAQTYFEGLIGQLGVDGQQATRLAFNSATLQQAVTERRASVSSVSLDEEMTNMIIFQQAYNASARMITVVDETLDKIINGMGRAGL